MELVLEVVAVTLITSGVATGSGLYASISGDLILFNLDSRAEGSVSLTYDSNTAVYSGYCKFFSRGGASVTVSGALEQAIQLATFGSIQMRASVCLCIGQ